jgi:hypothetical protein
MSAKPSRAVKGDQIDPARLTLGEIFQSMSIPQLAMILTTAFAIIGFAVAAGSYWPGLAKLFP